MRALSNRLTLQGLLLWLLLPITQGFAQDQSPAETLDFARDTFVYGDYDSVIRTLQPPLESGELGLERDQLIDAWTLLAVSAHLIGDHALAEQAFVNLLHLDPYYRLDPLLYTPAVRMFLQEVRQRNLADLPLSNADPESPPVVYIESRVETQTLMVSMLPFGYGFFSGGEDIPGFFYLASQAGTGLASLVLFILNESSRDVRGFFPDPQRAQRRRGAQIITGWTFIGLIVANAVHGGIAHPRFSRVEYRGLDEAPTAGAPTTIPPLARANNLPAAGFSISFSIR